MKMFKTIVAGMFALTGALASVPAGAQSAAPAAPVVQSVDLGGVWQADNGESQYALELCGDGTQLCARLTWIQPDKINDRNKKYVGKLVVDQAKLVNQDPMTWAGNINIYGNVVSGKVTLVNPDRFTVRGCAFFFFCEETGANRVNAPAQS